MRPQTTPSIRRLARLTRMGRVEIPGAATRAHTPTLLRAPSAWRDMGGAPGPSYPAAVARQGPSTGQETLYPPHSIISVGSSTQPVYVEYMAMSPVGSPVKRGLP